MGGRIRAAKPTRAQLLEQFRRVTAAIDPELGADPRWADEPIAHFLHAFRPDGARLPALFEGIPRSAGVLERLRTVFAHAGTETGQMYFWVSRPSDASDADVTDKARAWASTLGSLVEVAGLADEQDAPMLNRLAHELPVDLMARAPDERPPHALQALVYEAMQFYRDQVEYPLFAELLVEPLYMIACRYDLVHWILRPSLGPVDDDLFAPLGELWLAGVELAFVGDGADVRVQAWRTTAGIV